MANTPFTIRIFIPDGDPENLRVIDRMNWTGTGLVFPRAKWSSVKHRSEFSRTGVYILVGYSDRDDDLPTIYIGEGDVVRDRLDSHWQKKDFWTDAYVFVSSNNSLNKAYVRWLEYSLIQKASQANRSVLDNGTDPQEPPLSEAERADGQAFLTEISQILPLAGLRVFEEPKPVALPQTAGATPNPQGTRVSIDTVVVPAQEEGFQKVFLREN